MSSSGNAFMAGLTEPYAYSRSFSELLALPGSSPPASVVHAVPGEYVERLLVLRLGYHAIAGGVFPVLRIHGGDGAELFLRPQLAAMPVGDSIIQYVLGAFPETLAGGSTQFLPLPPYFLLPTFEVRVDFFVTDPGDTVSGVQLYVERFGTGPLDYPTGAVAEEPAEAVRPPREPTQSEQVLERARREFSASERLATQ